jgi:hypothetical protein
MWRVTGQVDWRRAYCDTILAVVDATAVGENVDIGTLGAKLAVALCEILANGLGGVAEIVAEGTGAARLAGTLPEELARNMACVGRASGTLKAGSSSHAGTVRSTAVGGVQAGGPHMTIVRHGGGFGGGAKERARRAKAEEPVSEQVERDSLTLSRALTQSLGRGETVPLERDNG